MSYISNFYVNLHSKEFKAINACLFLVGVALLLFCTCTHQLKSPDLSVALFLKVYSWVDEAGGIQAVTVFIYQGCQIIYFIGLWAVLPPPPPMNPYDLLFSSGHLSVCFWLSTLGE